ncbi:hypothetical protein TRFO_02690 [Tritrichomonas foetus]|uniref:Tetraspanin family protein n=1 Tax=Tritrichomonas foetus TaxID=1144522 RepID=A0A1J4KYV5_9EUKA|nr:hypothetical protein TRFO_02690 [Tritrichomonas foetus]|eukprot:OHT16431.1 hypothetical protein TRFO_02690 [Tritrichomonas foetus]
MSIGTFLTLQSESILSAFKAFLFLSLLSFFVTGIFNSVFASDVNNGIFEHLDKGQALVDIQISLAVIGFASIFMFLFMLAILYNFGHAFVAHFILLVIDLASIVGDIVLLSFSIHFTSSNIEQTYVTSFGNLLSMPNPQPKIREWMEDHKCNSLVSCYPIAESYIHKIVKYGFIGNIVLVALTAASLLGLIVVLIFMGLQKPVDRNEYPSSSSEGGDDPEAPQTDAERQRRESVY